MNSGSKTGRRFRVLDLRDTYEIGGPGKTIIETYKDLDADRFQMYLGVFARRNEPADTPFVAAAHDCGLPVHVLRGFNQYDPRLISQLTALVDSLAIDIIHAHEVKSDVITYLAARLRPVPIVTTLHGWIGNGVKQRFMIGLDKCVVRGFDRVIAVSKEIERELLAAGVEPEKICVLHNGIVLDRYRRTGRHGVLQRLIGRDLSRPIIASIGRLSPEKGHMDLIDAAALVKKQGRDFSLVLIGDGSERSNLTEKIRALHLEDVVYLVGYLPQPERFLEDIELMVLPSHTEGLPNVVLESLLMEVPVLATRVGGTPEVITDGATGRLVPAHSPEALAAGILEFLSCRDFWSRMAREGCKTVESQFDFRERTRKLEALYGDLMQNVGRK